MLTRHAASRLFRILLHSCQGGVDFHDAANVKCWFRGLGVRSWPKEVNCVPLSLAETSSLTNSVNQRDFVGLVVVYGKQCERVSAAKCGHVQSSSIDGSRKARVAEGEAGTGRWKPSSRRRVDAARPRSSGLFGRPRPVANDFEDKARNTKFGVPLSLVAVGRREFDRLGEALRPVEYRRSRLYALWAVCFVRVCNAPGGEVLYTE